MNSPFCIDSYPFTPSGDFWYCYYEGEFFTFKLSNANIAYLSYKWVHKIAPEDIEIELFRGRDGLNIEIMLLNDGKVKTSTCLHGDLVAKS